MSARKNKKTVAVLGDVVYDVDKLSPPEREWLYNELRAQDEREKARTGALTAK